MGRTILCNECKSTFDEDILKKRNSENECPVCGASLVGGGNSSVYKEPIENDEDSINNERFAEKMTYYYYDNGTLVPVLYYNWKPLYTFEAIDKEDAERQLKKVCPSSPIFKDSPASSSVIRCPRCFGTEYTLLNKGFSIFTGFLGSGRVKRVCNYCKKEF